MSDIIRALSRPRAFACAISCLVVSLASPAAAANTEDRGVRAIDASSVRSIDASSTASIDASSIYSIDASSSASIDASSVYSIDASSSASIDASSVYSIDASSSASIDASSVYSIDASSSASIDASSVYSIDASSSALIDASSISISDFAGGHHVLTGPIDAIDYGNGTFTSLGQTVSAGNDMLGNLSVGDYIAVPVEGEEYARVHAEHPLPLPVRILMGFPPPRNLLHLDPRSPAESHPEDLGVDWWDLQAREEKDGN